MRQKLTLMLLVFCLFVVSFSIHNTEKINEPQPQHGSSNHSLYVLIIGVNDHHPPQDGDIFANEAEELRDAIETTPFLFNLTTKSLLRTEATHDAWLKDFDWVCENTKAGDVAIIYISTHGCDGKESFLFVAKDKFVTGKEVKACLSKVRGTLILVADACHSEALIKDWGDCNGRVAIISACQTKETAFAYHLSVALKDSFQNADYNDDGFITLEEIEKYCQEHCSDEHVCVSSNCPKLRLIKLD